MIYIERTAEQHYIRIPLLTWVNRDELTLHLTLRSTVGNEVGELEVTGIAKGRYLCAELGVLPGWLHAGEREWSYNETNVETRLTFACSGLLMVTEKPAGSVQYEQAITYKQYDGE
jgi:hypothetical protein